jgi:hypothetical protein
VATKLGGSRLRQGPRLAQRGQTDGSNTILPRRWGAVATPRRMQAMRTVIPPFLQGIPVCVSNRAISVCSSNQRLATSVE